MEEEKRKLLTTEMVISKIQVPKRITRRRKRKKIQNLTERDLLESSFSDRKIEKIITKLWEKRITLSRTEKLRPEDDIRNLKKYQEIIAQYNIATGEMYYELGLFYSSKIKNWNQALPYYFEAANQGYIEASYALGIYFFLELNSPHALKWLKLVADEGDWRASYLIGRYYECNGREDLAVKWYRHGMKDGNILAQCKFTNMWWLGKDDKKRGHLVIKAYNKIFTNTFLEIEDFLLNYFATYSKIVGYTGELTAKIVTEGWKKEFILALYHWGSCYYLGYVIKKNINKAVEKYKLVISYKDRDFFPADEINFESMGDCFHDAGENKLAIQCYKICLVMISRFDDSVDDFGYSSDGDIMYKISNCSDDWDEDKKWLMKAAISGCESAVRGLNYLMKNPIKYDDGEEDYGDDYGDMQYTLGYCFQHGRGIKKNIKRAIYWYKKAQKRGNELAEKAIENAAKDFIDSI